MTFMMRLSPDLTEDKTVPKIKFERQSNQLEACRYNLIDLIEKNDIVKKGKMKYIQKCWRFKQGPEPLKSKVICS